MNIGGDASKQQYYASKSKTTRSVRNITSETLNEESKNQVSVHNTLEELIYNKFPDMVNEFQWDPEASSKEISFSADFRHGFLYETNYYFRTIASNKPFFGGIHYWEIIADARTEHELKIGVTAQ